MQHCLHLLKHPLLNILLTQLLHVETDLSCSQLYLLVWLSGVEQTLKVVGHYRPKSFILFTVHLLHVLHVVTVILQCRQLIPQLTDRLFLLLFLLAHNTMISLPRPSPLPGRVLSTLLGLHCPCTPFSLLHVLNFLVKLLD